MLWKVVLTATSIFGTMYDAKPRACVRKGLSTLQYGLSRAVSGNFALTSQDGLPVTLGDFRGRVVAVTFVYTRCPDVCPLLTDKMARSERTKRVFIDTSQNDPGKQTIAPYSLRATTVPVVSAPLAWDELDRLSPIQPRAMLERVERLGDLFAGVLTLEQRLG